MFTNGFRLFFGFALFALFAAGVYGVASGDLTGKDYLGVVDPSAIIGVLSLGWKGGVGDHVGYTVLVVFALVAGFLGLLLVAFRDADAERVAEITPSGEVPPPTQTPAPSFAPIVSSFAAGVMVVGLVTTKAVFIAGAILMFVVMGAWMINAWADRATGDPAVNRALRDRVLAPFQIPVFAAAGVGVLVLALSRVLIAVSAAAAVWIAFAVAAGILVVAAVIASAPQMSKSVAVGALAVGAIAVLVAGIASTAIGEREFEHEGEEHEGEGEEHGNEESGLAVVAEDGSTVGISFSLGPA